MDPNVAIAMANLYYPPKPMTSCEKTDCGEGLGVSGHGCQPNFNAKRCVLKVGDEVCGAKAKMDGVWDTAISREKTAVTKTLEP